MKIRAGHPLSAAAFGILLLVEFATIQAGPVNASEDDSLPQPIVELNEQFLAL
ncbi:MAG TPA: hypothetical protein VG759_03800 [Candidatus Angelobacter sp.]|jgi:hypothetical protein|nr:hypothetical protein [Candidatus Angelobacter sp.]